MSSKVNNRIVTCILVGVIAILLLIQIFVLRYEYIVVPKEKLWESTDEYFYRIDRFTEKYCISFEDKDSHKLKCMGEK